MKIQVLLTLDFDPITKECKILKSVPFNDVDDKPKIILKKNKLQLNPKAVEWLKFKDDNKRISIRYVQIDGAEVPVIGSSSSWNDSEGNKLTKSLTVSFKGIPNETLSKYGTEFILEDTTATGEGIYILKGDKDIPKEAVMEDPNVEIPVDNSTEIDIQQEELDIDSELQDIDFDDII